MLMPGFGTVADPRAEIGSVDDANAANTAVLMVGDSLWALWEAGSPLAINPETLATRDFVSLRPDLKGMPFLAHPRVEPGGRIWNLGMNGDQALVWRLAADGTLEDAQVIALPRASYVHDFTATARHLVIVLQPWIRARPVVPFNAGFDWRPDEGTQVLVLDKADLTVRRLYTLPTFGFFHLGDAWETADGAIRFDVCAHQSMRFAAQGGGEMLNGVPLGGQAARLALVTLTADGRGRFESTGIAAEFPRSDPRRAGQARRAQPHTTGETPGRLFARAVGLYDWARATGTVLRLRTRPCAGRNGLRAQARCHGRARRLADRAVDRSGSQEQRTACVGCGADRGRAGGFMAQRHRGAGRLPRHLARLRAEVQYQPA